MIFTGLTITKDRAEAVDFSYPFFVDPTNVVFRVWDRKESFFYKPIRLKVCSTHVGHKYVCIIHKDSCISLHILHIYLHKKVFSFEVH